MLTPRKTLFAVALVLLCCALLNTRWTGWLSRPVHSFVTTVQRPAGWLAASTKTNPPQELPDATEQQLKQRMEETQVYIRALWDENKNLKRELDAFKAIFETQDIEAIRPVVGKVSRFNDDRINPTMTVLRGTLHGVKKNDPVVYYTNLVGFVQEVGPASCTVNLVTRPDYRTQVNIMPPNQDRMENNWPVVGRVESDGKGGFVCDLGLSFEDAKKSLRPKDVVSVSDTLRPKANGFVLGVIEKIEKHPDRPLQLSRLTIRPRTPLGPQQTVTILTERKD